MRIRIAHETRYTYDQPARSVCQVLRLTPRPHDGQHIVHWRVDLDADARITQGEDAFGNIIHSVVADKPVRAMTLSVTGEVDTTDSHGLLAGVLERLAPAVYLRPTPFTELDTALAAFADESGSAASDPLGQMHALMQAIHGKVAFDTRATTVATSAAQAFAQGRGVCQDLSHVFIACARRLGVPARYVSGHLARADGVVEQEASHAWAEAFIQDLGWVGFDVANGICPNAQHVRVATGFDYLGAAPVRGTRAGGGVEHLNVRLRVSGGGTVQTQSQG